MAKVVSESFGNSAGDALKHFVLPPCLRNVVDGFAVVRLGERAVDAEGVQEPREDGVPAGSEEDHLAEESDPAGVVAHSA